MVGLRRLRRPSNFPEVKAKVKEKYDDGGENEESMAAKDV